MTGVTTFWDLRRRVYEGAKISPIHAPFAKTGDSFPALVA